MLQSSFWPDSSAGADGGAAVSSTPSGEEDTAGAQRQDAENRALREQVSVQTAEITELKRRLAVTEDQALTSADAAEKESVCAIRSSNVEGILEALSHSADDATLRAKFGVICDVRNSSDRPCMSRVALSAALADLHVKRSQGEIDELVSRTDVNADGLIDFDEFCLFVKGSSDLELLLQSVPIVRALSHELGGNVESYVKLSDSAVDEAAKAFVPVVSALLKKNIRTLRQAEESGIGVQAEESTGNEKFAFPIAGGTLDDFNGGITERLGPPRANIAEGIKMEHTESADADIPFTTGNYGITTTPRKEYKLITDGEQVDYEEPQLKGRGATRVVRPLEWYGKFDEKTGRLIERVETTPDVVEMARLTLMDILAIVLYTGTHIHCDFMCYSVKHACFLEAPIVGGGFWRVRTDISDRK